MRCKICDAILTDTEAVAKDEFGKFLDICEYCLYEDTDPDYSDAYDDPDYVDPEDILS